MVLATLLCRNKWSTNSLFLLDMQHQSNNMIWGFLRLSIVRIFPKEAVQAKKVAFVGALVYHIFLHKNALLRWLVKLW